MENNKELTVEDINFTKQEIIDMNAKEIARTKEIETRLESLVKEYGVKDFFELIKSCRDLEYTDQKFQEVFGVNQEFFSTDNQEVQDNNIIDIDFEDNFKKRELFEYDAKHPSYIYWNSKTGKYCVDHVKLSKEINSEEVFIEDEAWYDKIENFWHFESTTRMVKHLINIKLTDVIVDGKNMNFWSTRIEKETIGHIKSSYGRQKDASYLFDNSEPLKSSYSRQKNASYLFDNSKPHLVQFDNGIYNIFTGKLLAHNPEEYILTHHPYSLNMDRALFPIRTIRWLYALTGNFESVRYLIQLCGYLFYRSHSKFNVITILDGRGANGKSVFLDFLSKLVGEDYTSSVSIKSLGNEQNRFASSGLYGSSVNFTAENTNGFIETDTLKSLTSGDRISVEFKGKDAFPFANYSKQIFASNSKPSFRDSSYGFSRRLKVVNFNSEIDNIFIAQHHIDEIIEEIPVFTRFAMEHFNLAFKKNKMAESGNMKESKDEWLYNQNSVQRFVDEECKVVDVKVGEKTRVLHEAFKNFCSMDGIKELSMVNFLAELKELGYEKKRFKSTDDEERCMRIPGVILKKDRESSKFSTRRSNELAHLETREFDNIRNHNKKLDEMATHEYNRIAQGRNNNFEGEKNSESK